MYFYNHASLSWLGLLFSFCANYFVLASNQASISLNSGCHNHIAFRVQPTTEPLLNGSQEGNLKVQTGNGTIVDYFLARLRYSYTAEQQTPWSLALLATRCEAACSLTSHSKWLMGEQRSRFLYLEGCGFLSYCLYCTSTGKIYCASTNLNTDML